MHKKTITDLIKGLKNKEFSITELTSHFIKRVKEVDNQHKLNCFITITEESALDKARKADKIYSSEKLDQISTKSLLGIPIAHKDIFCTKGVRTTCASKMLHNFVPTYDATVVERLNDAGVITIGKTNMDEFAMGSSTENSYYGPVKNPWDVTKVPGGSSGGSAAAVAARLIPCATGTDTGGSVRQPASFCGITGLKPTYGLISRYGMIAFASSLDQAGIFARTAEDIAIVLQVIAGTDEKDSTSARDIKLPNYVEEINSDLQKKGAEPTSSKSLDGIKIGVPKEYFSKESNFSAGMTKCFDETIKKLKDFGATICEISLPHMNVAVATYYIIAPAECSSNLARYDGVRYGHRCENPSDLMDLYVRSRSEGFGNEVKRRIIVGTYVLSSGYYDAYYVRAQEARRLIKNDFAVAFEKVDAILGPTAPTTAFGIGENVNDPIKMYLSDLYTIPVNLAGLPGISFPVGFEGQLPVGMQLIGNRFQESKLLKIVHEYQRETDWHQMEPKIYE